MARKPIRGRPVSPVKTVKPSVEKVPMSYYKEDEGLVIKDAQYRVTQMHYNNNPWGNFDADNPVEETTQVRLMLHEWDEAKHKAANGDSAVSFADVSAAEARNIHIGDMLVVRVIIPEKEVE